MVILAEALSLEPVLNGNGQKLYRARVLPSDSEKSKAMQELLQCRAISYFLELHQMLDCALGCTDPLVIVTDWSDPCEVVGLRLETEQGILDYPELCFVAFETNWSDLRKSGIPQIFSHELSHLWLHRMGYQPGLSQSNRFHTSTAITDPYLAFSEGFAEHFEIAGADLIGDKENEEFYDSGYDIGAWLCARDSALRLHAVKNNRFLYLTATPLEEDFGSYQQLHMAHITSSAFMPERLKNGLQAVSSEGLIASFFYQMYRCEALRQSPAPETVYEKFGCASGDLLPMTNFYVKILWALTQIDLKSPKLFTDFVASYLNAFAPDRSVVLELFCKVTNFVTVDSRAQRLFGTLYRIGRQGDPDTLILTCRQTEAQKSVWLQDLRNGNRRLDDAIYKSLWVDADKRIRPVPWDSEHTVPLRMDVNAATDVDFFALEGLTFTQCQEIVEIREEIHGFSDIEAFRECVEHVRHSG